MRRFHQSAEYFRAVIVGFLLVFIASILRELSVRPVYLLGALVVGVGAWFLAKHTVRHFHGGHTHAGDHAIDLAAGGVLFLANIFHPAIDGFSLYQTILSRGIVAGIFFAASIAIHELFRQTALITAFKQLGIKSQWVILTALVGIVLGIGTGLLGARIVDTHERIVDMVTLFAYVFIIAEFWYSGHVKNKTKAAWFVTLGIIIGSVLSVFFQAH